ncbi:MAG TPA: hypothetical protein DCR93_34195 [Cytophagales bacterium]|nr:hypothetical protein [Cytophagales bacterium]HAP64321.1 hypothetical protein [Cytophagales bacterium]
MKKAILFLAFLVPALTYAQVKGNGTVVTQQFDLAELTRLQMELYAQVTVDASAESGITITGDENLIPLLNYDIRDGRMVLQQREWIQPTQPIQVTIGAPALTSVEVGVHETVKVINLNRDDFNARALLGKVELSGQVTTLNASAERGGVDARNLQVQTVDVNMWDAGLIQIGEAQKITGLVQQAGQVVYANDDTRVSVRKQQGASVLSEAEVAQQPLEDHRFIQFQLRNNSGKRIHCYVSGPKPQGGRFSYGFPMNPGQTRDKDWSIGSKVYLVSAIGTRKLLYEIKAEDEGQVVKLYQN